MYRIRTYNQISDKGLSRFPMDRYEVGPDLDEPDAFVLRSQKLHDEPVSESVLAVARAGAGVNNIPIDEYSRRGIVVFNTPGANANAVKEMVAAALLLGSRRILDGMNRVQELTDIEDPELMAKQLEKEKKQFGGSEIAGKTLGVVGLGAIRSMVANMALEMGMHVAGFDPALSVEAAWRLSSRVQKADAISSLFARCDYITLHLPVLDSTRGLVNAELLANVRPGTCLVNFARQEIVDNEAIIEALDAGKLRKYIADFPAPGLIGRDDVILMPHIGASTDEAEDNCAIMAAEQLRDFLENGNIRNSVNFPATQLEHVTGCRLAVTNENVPRVLTSILAILAEANINVIDMLNKSRDEIAYNLIDIESQPSEAALVSMEALEGVISARLIGDCCS